MQDYRGYVNPARMQYMDECEKVLIAELEYTSQGMQDAMQQFADLRDRNMQAQFKLIALRNGQVA